jgi:hypothetical protein
MYLFSFAFLGFTKYLPLDDVWLRSEEVGILMLIDDSERLMLGFS